MSRISEIDGVAVTLFDGFRFRPPLPSRAAEVGSPSKKLIKEALNNEITLIPPRRLGRETGAAELLHNVRCNQTLAGLTIDDGTLVIINRRIGETPRRAYAT
jgi:hypothetical protein